MFSPNQYTLSENGKVYGLHTFKGGDTMLAQRHHSGEWFTIRPANAYETAYFAQHGTKAAKPAKTDKVDSQIMTAEVMTESKEKNTMQTVMTTNNGYDSILLVDENDVVVSAWQADKKTIHDYIADGAKADGWHTGEWDTFADPETENDEDLAAKLRTIEAYGEEVGRNGQITDKNRAEFWGI